MFLELVTLGWQSHQDKLSKDAHGNATSGWRESRCAASVLLLRSVGSLAAQFIHLESCFYSCQCQSVVMLVVLNQHVRKLAEKKHTYEKEESGQGQMSEHRKTCDAQIQSGSSDVFQRYFWMSFPVVKALFTKLTQTVTNRKGFLNSNLQRGSFRTLQIVKMTVIPHFL